MRTRYIRAALIGAFIGLCLILGDAITGNCEFTIPVWDDVDPIFQDRPVPREYVETYRPSAILDLQYKAVFLRFFLILLNDGFWKLSIPILISMFFVYWNAMGEKDILLACLRRGLKATGLIFLSYYLVSHVSGWHDCFGGMPAEQIARKMIGSFQYWYFIVLMWMSAVPVWIVSTAVFLFLSKRKKKEKGFFGDCEIAKKELPNQTG